MRFEPIAIVGRACLLPGATNPERLWDAVQAGRDLVGRVPADRWGLSPRHAMGTADASGDRTWSDRGGYVTGFDELFDPSGFALEADTVARLDRLFKWVLHTGREALVDAGSPPTARTGAIIGNLSFPSEGMAHFAERVWLGDELADRAGLPKPGAQSRFMSGLPAHVLAQALELGGPAYALDAACASSLYAVKLACDALSDRRADVMLAGAVNAADDLFIHVGFCALKALSATGQSRPFNARADGLVPAEGAGMVVLKRLADARKAGDRILGVIRGVGLSNDGRGQGLLQPSQRGQVRALRQAYEQSGLTPRDIGLLECHATGTTIGDRTELRSMAEVFAGCEGVPIGSLKSNMGHLITAAGVAGLIKMTLALEHGKMPPSLHASPGNAALERSPFRVVEQLEDWTGPRRAGVSAFGFGGNNAHLIVEAPELTRAAYTAPAVPEQGVAVVAMARRLEPTEVVLSAEDLRFPPKDLQRALAQQLLLLEVTVEACRGLPLEPDRTGVFVGMGADPEVARYGARWRLAQWVESWGVDDPDWLSRARDAVVPLLESPGVLGAMPNIPANRVNSALNLGGQSLTVSSEELSGVRALEMAARAIAAGDLDYAVVGAVDLCAEPVHQAALNVMAPGRIGQDGAVVLVLSRADAPLPQLATLEGQGGQPFEAPPHGAHAASGLLAVAHAIATAAPGEHRALKLSALGGQTATVSIRRGEASVVAAAEPARALRFPLHPGPIVLPALPKPEARAVPESDHYKPLPAPSGAQAMPRAPELVAITTNGDSPAQQAAVRRAIPRAPETAAAPSSGAAAESSSGAAPAALVAHAQLASVHAQFMQQQAAAHTQFLEMQARTQSAFLRRFRSGAPVLPPAPQVPNARAPSAPIAPAPSNPVAAVRSEPHVSPPPPAPPARVPAKPEPLVAKRTTAPAAELGLEMVAPREPIGVKLDRAQLQIHASGRISEIYGELFLPQDGYARQVRMPEPPLLLADRVVGLDAEPASMGKGTIWTETDVTWDAWYLHDGRMPAGIMIESGQADLMLISYLGIDLFNRGERFYRLLGCELTYHGGLPQPGDTMRYDIHVDGHASQGPIRLFFFHYDCRVDGEVRLSVREGQAGFFTDQELEASKGVIWDAATADHHANARVDAPAVDCQRSAFDRAALEAFAAGRPLECFGAGFEYGATHTRSPRIPGGRMLLLDEVTHFEADGGPWGRGYLRAVDAIEPDDWFFDGHFKNDSCMPGTLMFEGCLQAMAIHMAGLGYTLNNDGWRFEPVPGETYSLRCRGQVDRESSLLEYEVFVEEVIDGPYPTIYADLLCTVDGLKAFHCRRMGLRLVPGWPMDSRPDLLAGYVEPKPVASKGGFHFDYASLMACAWDRPSHAFGKEYAVFDDTRRVARLPGPPYHFMSRVARIDGELWQSKPGVEVVIEYDVPLDVWYFRENGAATMPFCVLLEAALQPCGWLASAVGSALTIDTDVFFRNLDGTGTLKAELLPGCGTLSTHVKITSVSSSAGMIIESFEVECTRDDGTVVYELKTVFGFFPGEALATQIGLPITAPHKAQLAAHTEVVDLTSRPARYFAQNLLPTPYLLMIDRVVNSNPTGGEAGLGQYRAEKDVNPSEWFFKAHFYQDPVQPGSLGIEAMIQLLQFAMIDCGMADGLDTPRFEPLMLDRAMTWKYRGQVRPHNKVISSTIEIVEVGADERGRFAVATASLWVDGLRIYEAENLGMRLVTTPIDTRAWDIVIDPIEEPWVGDHRPTYTVPSLPMMSVVDLLAQVATTEGRVTTAVKDVRISRWITVEDTVRLRPEVTEGNGEASRVRLFDGDELVASGTVLLDENWTHGPAPMKPLAGVVAPDPYETGQLFHGPAFQKLRRLVMGSGGSSTLLDASPGAVGAGVLNPALLDAATHGIPHDRLHQWSSDVPTDVVAYPATLNHICFHGPTPVGGEVRCEVRLAGVSAGKLVHFEGQLIQGDRVWATFRLTEVFFPKGPLGSADPRARRRFLQARQAAEGVALSRRRGNETVLRVADVEASNWLPGTLEAVYGTADPVRIAWLEHAAWELPGVHPGHVEGALPLNQPEIECREEDGVVRANSTGPGTLDLEPVTRVWRERFGLERWPVADLFYGLVRRFVRRVVLTDPEGFAALDGRPVLYLANHQVGIESLLFSIIAGAIGPGVTLTLAKSEHRETWLGRLIGHAFSHPDVKDPGVIAFFERTDPASLPTIARELGVAMRDQGKSVLVHAEGTRALSGRQPVAAVSSAFVDLALAVGAWIVPVRFVGGLPVAAAQERLEFPVNFGQQDYWLGRAMSPDELSNMAYAERRQAIIAAINALGPEAAREMPLPAPTPLAGVNADSSVAEVLHAVLAESANCEDSERILAGGPFATEDDAQERWLAGLAALLSRG